MHLSRLRKRNNVHWEGFVMEYKFEANENNAYNDYFSAYWTDYRSNGKNKTDVYREHLQTASKDKLIDIAIEGNSLYTSANDLAYNRGLEIDNLNQEIKHLSNNLAIKNKKVDNYRAISFIAIGVCIFSISIFYIYQYIKHRLKKYADKIRTETIEELENYK